MHNFHCVSSEYGGNISVYSSHEWNKDCKYNYLVSEKSNARNIFYSFYVKQYFDIKKELLSR